jgi:hypothetical protein
MKRVLLVLLMVMVIGNAWALNTTIAPIKQKNLPIEYIDCSGGTQSISQMIQYNIKYLSTAEDQIEAIEFGFVSYGVWGDLLDFSYGFGGDSTRPGERMKKTWNMPRDKGYEIASGYIFLNRIHYENGKTWTADRNEIQSELSKIRPGFDLNKLTPKYENAR